MDNSAFIPQGKSSPVKGEEIYKGNDYHRVCRYAFSPLRGEKKRGGESRYLDDESFLI
ncbi:MAG: hypothetical protein ISR95_04495 [Candidatus Marinimicrobia bacterium]|nr:hypothetical protein [Candidatus Neomarinimicrobiota bacterium]